MRSIESDSPKTDEESDGEGGMSVASLLAEEEESNVWMTFSFT